MGKFLLFWSHCSKNIPNIRDSTPWPTKGSPFSFILSHPFSADQTDNSLKAPKNVPFDWSLFSFEILKNPHKKTLGRDGFSRGGGLKNFFRSTKLIFWALFNLYKNPSLFKKFCAAVKLLKKTVFRHFLEKLDHKIAFFGARSHLKICIIRRL